MGHLKLSLLATITFLILSVFFAISEKNRPMVSIIGTKEKRITEDLIRNQLPWLEVNSSTTATHITPILECTTNSNQLIRIVIAEGDLKNKTVNPEVKWKELLKEKPTLILNSPDESYSCPTSGINGEICEACNIKELRTPQKPGSVKILDCEKGFSNYDKLGIEYVANAVVVNFKDKYSEEIIQSDNFKSIWEPNLENSVKELFDRINSHEFTGIFPRSFIIPSIGTGFGGTYANIPKGLFYSAFFKALNNEIQKKESSLAGNIILMLYSGDIKDEDTTKVNEIRNSITEGLISLYEERNNPANKRDIKFYLNSIGISFSLIIILIFVLSSKNKFFYSKKKIINEKGVFITIGIYIIAFSLVDSFEKLPEFPITMFKGMPIVKQLLMGALSVPLSIFLTNVAEITKPQIALEQ